MWIKHADYMYSDSLKYVCSEQFTIYMIHTNSPHKCKLGTCGYAVDT